MEKKNLRSELMWHKYSEVKPPVGAMLILMDEGRFTFPAVYLKGVPFVTDRGGLKLRPQSESLYIWVSEDEDWCDEEGFFYSNIYNNSNDNLYWALLSDLAIEGSEGGEE